MSPRLSLSLQWADPRHRALVPRHKVARWIRRALDCDAEITVRVVDVEEGRALNRADLRLQRCPRGGG
jgi:probable rRNA maturation factor